MEIIDNVLYYFADFRRYLKGQGLYHGKNTIINYEKEGIIPSPRNPRNGWRAYTGQQMKAYAAKIKQFLFDV